MSLDEPNRQASDRPTGDAGRLNVIAEHNEDLGPCDAAEDPPPARRKLVTFDKLTRASPVGAVPASSGNRRDGNPAFPLASDVAGIDEAAGALIRQGGAASTQSELIAAKSRQEANMKQVRASGSIIRRTLDCLK